MLLVITGGTGTLGKAILSHQLKLATLGITRIRVLSRDEQKQVSIQRNYRGKIPLDLYLGDVGDRERMKFAIRDADYLIHAAAQKHIDKFELDVPTGYKTNILGTQFVSEAFMNSKNAKAATFVSTDKAAEPTTSYGISKLAAEHGWLWHTTYQKEIAMRVVRYGNVFGSKGSVIGLWTELAKKAEPLPITHPASTRFFTSDIEAALFVLQSFRETKPSPLIPKMKSAKMIEVAEMIWKKYNTNALQFKIIGLRQNEKLHEVLRPGAPSSLEAERFSTSELEGLYLRWIEDHANTHYQ